MYSLVAMIALAQVYVLLNLLNVKAILDARFGVSRMTWRWVAFILIGVIGVYTHLHYWLFLAGMSLTFVRERHVLPWWKGFAALCSVAVIYTLNYQSLLMFMLSACTPPSASVRVRMAC